MEKVVLDKEGLQLHTPGLPVVRVESGQLGIASEELRLTRLQLLLSAAARLFLALLLGLVVRRRMARLLRQALQLWQAAEHSVDSLPQLLILSTLLMHGELLLLTLAPQKINCLGKDKRAGHLLLQLRT